MNIHDVVQYPISTEKSLRLMEAENKLIFVVHPHSTKPDIKRSIESLFKTKVKNVNTTRTMGGEKRAYVTFAPDVNAIDIATNLGLM